MNRAAGVLTGWANAEALGTPVEDVFLLVDGATRERMASPAKRAMNQERRVELELGSILIRHDSLTDLPNRLLLMERLTQIEGNRDAIRIAQKLLARMDRFRVVEGHWIRITLSIGVSHYPENGLDAAALMNNADAAMHRSKFEGRNGFHLSSGQSSMSSPAGVTADTPQMTAPALKT